MLRRKPPGKLLPSAHAVDREYRVISALSAQGFPVAKPFVYCADEAVAGTPFYVMDYADGRVFWEPQMPGSNPAERTAVYDAMNDTIAKLHGFDPAQIGLGDFGKGENYVARQVARWSKQYRASETEKIEEMERLIDWLPQHLPPSGPIRVVHGDYRIDNLIVAKNAPKVIAVLDWELSTLGDPLADFSYHLMAWHMPHSDSAAGTATLRRTRSRCPRHSVHGCLRRYLCGTHRARSAPLSPGLSRLQFLPYRRHPARHHRPRPRRHRDLGARASESGYDQAACTHGVGLRQAGVSLFPLPAHAGRGETESTSGFRYHPDFTTGRRVALTPRRYTLART